MVFAGYDAFACFVFEFESEHTRTGTDIKRFFRLTRLWMVLCGLVSTRLKSWATSFRLLRRLWIEWMDTDERKYLALSGLWGGVRILTQGCAPAPPWAIKYRPFRPQSKTSIPA